MAKPQSAPGNSAEKKRGRSESRTPDEKNVKRQKNDRRNSHSQSKKTRDGKGKPNPTDGEAPIRSKPRKNNHVSPKVVKDVRKKLAGSSMLEFAKVAKNKIKHASKKELADIIKPIVEVLSKDAQPMTSEEIANLFPKKKLTKVGELPLDKSTSDQAEWFWAQFEIFFQKKLAPSEIGPPVEGLHFLSLPAGQPEPTKADDFYLSKASEHIRNSLIDTVKLPEHSKDPGNPSVLVICASAVRCTDVLRAMKDVGKKFGTAKLFAKHMKIETQIEMLKKDIFLAAGTPARVERLIALGNLGLSNLKLVVLDLQQTAKDLTILDIPETRSDFWDLYWKHIHKTVVGDKVKICLI